MKKLVIAAVIVGAVVFLKHRSEANAVASDSPSILQSVLSKVAPSKTPQDRARDRFEEFMKSWKDGGVSLNDAEQAAACLWGRGKKFVGDNEDLKNCADSFDRWRKAKDLYVEKIDYEIGTYEREGDHTVVNVTINGYKHRIAIPDDANPMTWAD